MHKYLFIKRTAPVQQECTRMMH